MPSLESPDRARAAARLNQLRKVARVWEELLPLPIVRRRIGLDGLVGLVPGVGDVAGALVAGYGLVVAAQLRAPASVLGRMLLNIALDALIGAVPLLGDLFDIGWKAQGRNIALLERWLAAPDRERRRSVTLLAVLAAGLLAAVVATTWLAVRVMVWLFGG